MKRRVGLFGIIVLILNLLLSGCSDQDKPVKVTKTMNRVISDYILNVNNKAFEKTDKQFESHKIYGASEKKSGTIEVYLYYFYEGFNRSTQRRAVSGGSVPVRVKLKKSEGTYKVVGYKEAEDGSKYIDSIRKMFPKEYAEKVLNVSNQQTVVNTLQKEIDVKVVKWLKQ